MQARLVVSPARPVQQGITAGRGHTGVEHFDDYIDLLHQFGQLFVSLVHVSGIPGDSRHRGGIIAYPSRPDSVAAGDGGPVSPMVEWRGQVFIMRVYSVCRCRNKFPTKSFQQFLPTCLISSTKVICMQGLRRSRTSNWWWSHSVL